MILWRAVVIQAVRDVCSIDCETKGGVVRWLPSEDFETVCILADLEPSFMRRQFASLATMPPSLAKKYAFTLTTELESDW